MDFFQCFLRVVRVHCYCEQLLRGFVVLGDLFLVLLVLGVVFLDLLGFLWRGVL